MIRSPFLCGAALAAFAPALPAQTVLQNLDGPSGFGAGVRTLGDLDGDGLPELAVGDPDPFSQGTGGRVVVFRGGSNLPLYTVLEATPQSGFGSALGRTGDLDGDGLPELLVGATGDPQNPNAPSSATVHSGATGTLLATLPGAPGSRYGAAVIGLADVNGDGVPDYAIGAPADSSVLASAGRVEIRSGANHGLLRTLAGSQVDERFGAALATLPDQDGDGAPELLVGAPGVNRVVLHSGATGAVLRTFTGPTQTRGFGAAVDGVDDLDGDGLVDVVIGSPEEPSSFGSNGGAVRVYSNATTLLIHERLGGFTNDFHGSSVRGVPDLDNDGVRDYLAGGTMSGSSAFIAAGFVEGFSGATGEHLFWVNGTGSGALMGFSCDSAGDFDGNGLQDIAAGAPGFGSVVVAQAEDTVGDPYCFGDAAGLGCPCGNDNDGSTAGGQAGCANSVSAGGAQLLAAGSISATSGTLRLFAHGAVPNSPGLYFQGTTRVNGGQGSLFGDGLRCAGGPVKRLEVVVSDAAGLSSSTVDVASVGGVQPGDVRDYQLWFRDSQLSPCGTSFNLTNGLEIQWLP